MNLPRLIDGRVDMLGVLRQLAGTQEDGVEVRYVDSPKDSAASGYPAYVGEVVESEPVLELWIDGRIDSTTSIWEIESRYELIHFARGEVLVAGLGLAMAILHVLDQVDSVTVVERDSRVSSLVLPALRKYEEWEKVEVIERDIFQFDPGYNQRYDMIFFDIWPGSAIATPSRAGDIAILHRKFRSRQRDEISHMSSFGQRLVRKIGRRKGR